jgi:hypothetical protein
MRQRLTWAPLVLAMAVCAPVGAISAQGDSTVMPAGSVLKVRLDDTIGSDRNRKGDRFTATVVEEESGYSLPDGARVTGVIREVKRASKDSPGVLDVDFRTLRLPDGQQYRITGAATSLDEKNVRRTEDGRLVARSNSKNRTKFIAYGAGAGFLISTLTGGGSLKGALLGALGGLVYGEATKNKTNGREVVLKPGTEFGVRLDQRLALAGTWDDNYRRVPSRVDPEDYRP